ncbi:MAG: hypothetical protein ABEJ89_06005 [Haloarculaceae archaeon]
MSADDEPEAVADDVSFGGLSAVFWGLVVLGGVALFFWDFSGMVSAGLDSAGYPIDFINNLKVTLMTLEMIGGGGTVIVIGLVIWRFAAPNRERPARLRPGQGKYVLTVWVIAILFLMVLAIFMGAGTLAKTDQADRPAQNVQTNRQLDMEVVGAQWTWRMQVDGVPGTQSERVVLPANTLITMDITSGDVIHSFAIQELGIKKDAIPGNVNHASFMVDHVDGDTHVTVDGEQLPADAYQINCAELCGKGHSQMVATLYIVSPQDYRTFVQAHNGTLPDSFTTDGSGSQGLIRPAGVIDDV